MPATIPIDIAGATLDFRYTQRALHYPWSVEQSSSDYATSRAVVGVRYHRLEHFQLGRDGNTLDQPHSPVEGLVFEYSFF